MFARNGNLSARNGNRGRLARRWPVVAAIGAVGIGMAVIQVAHPLGASAAAGVQTATATSATSAAAKSVAVSCPSGTWAVGARAAVPGNPYGVHITRVWPLRGRVTVTADVFPGVTTRWKLTVTALCVTRTGDMEYVAGTAATGAKASADDQRYGVVASAMCPSGKELIGMGGRASGGRLEQLQPLGKDTPYTNDTSPLMHGVRVLGAPMADAAGDATIQGMAVCADSGHGSAVGFAENSGTTSPRTLSASCPAGTEVHAMGYVAFYPNHYADGTAYSYPTLSRFDSPGGAQSMQLVAQRHRDGVPDEEWQLIAELLCAA
jgi:hypothetical protein